MNKTLIKQAFSLRSQGDTVVITEVDFHRAIVNPAALTHELAELAKRNSNPPNTDLSDVPTWGVENGGVPLSLMTKCAQIGSMKCFETLWRGASEYAYKTSTDSVWRVRIQFDFEESLREWDTSIDFNDEADVARHKALLDNALVLYYEIFGKRAALRLNKLVKDPGFAKVHMLCGDHISDQIEQWNARDEIRGLFKGGESSA